jgi:predicted phosphodiesterase
VIGHTQYLASNKTKYQLFLKHLNKNKSDYIFFLGDSNLGQKDVFEGLDEKIKKKIFSVPGNHEYRLGIKSYVDRVGYLNNNFETERVIFLLLDSNQPLINVKKIMIKWKEKYKSTNKKVILLTHHRIWDDSIISAKPFKHDKSFYFRDIFEFLNGFVDIIIAGNSKRQYFQDLPAVLKKNEIPNFTTIYWEENISGIKVYNIGMGNGFPYATYVSFHFYDDFLVPVSRSIKVSNDGLDKLGLVDMNLYNGIIRDSNARNLTFIDKLKIYYKRYENFLNGFLGGIILFSFLLYIRRKFYWLK